MAKFALTIRVEYEADSSLEEELEAFDADSFRLDNDAQYQDFKQVLLDVADASEGRIGARASVSVDPA